MLLKTFPARAAATLSALALAAVLPVHAGSTVGGSGSILFVGRIVDSGPLVQSWTAAPGGSPRQSADGLTRVALSPLGGDHAATVRAQAVDGGLLALRCAGDAAPRASTCRIGATGTPDPRGRTVAFAAAPDAGPLLPSRRTVLTVSYD